MAFVYSCCFWFSLRLGGLLIGIFGLFQSVLLLIVSCLVYANPEKVIDILTEWINTLDLGYYVKSFLENVKADPQGIASLTITLLCVYVVILILFMYGAYKFNTTIMIPYIVVEAARLLALSGTVAHCLLLLKQNTMDIGLLIGASVAGGFSLLGLFYLWICVVNLPVLINESKLEDQAATINKLQQLLEKSNNNQRSFVNGVDNIPYTTDYGLPRNLFTISRNRFPNRNILY